MDTRAAIHVEGTRTDVAEVKLERFIFVEDAPFHQKMADRVYNHLVRKIFESELEQGSRILEADMAKELSSSIIPGREAMLRLHHEGWVKQFPNRGSTVSDYRAPERLKQLYQVRQVLETGIFYKAAATITDKQLAVLNDIVGEIEVAHQKNQVLAYREVDADFHQKIAYFAGGSRMLRIFEPVLLQCFCFGILYKNIQKYDVETRLPKASHRSLYNALEAHDAALAAKVILEHITESERVDNM